MNKIKSTLIVKMMMYLYEHRIGPTVGIKMEDLKRKLGQPKAFSETVQYFHRKGWLKIRDIEMRTGTVTMVALTRQGRGKARRIQKALEEITELTMKEEDSLEEHSPRI